MPNTVSLVPIALLLMLLHPFSPGEPRSWTALELSTKAVAFTTAGNASVANRGALASALAAALPGDTVLVAAATSVWRRTARPLRVV